MEKVTVADLPELPYNPAGSTRRQLGNALGATDVSVNHFVVEPGESFSSGLHAHHDQEELFYVLAGEVTFDVGRERESVTVGAGEAIRFEPGAFQEGYSGGEEPVRALAIGAPKGTREIEFFVACPDCGTETVHEFGVGEEDGTVYSVQTCVECGSERRVELEG